MSNRFVGNPIRLTCSPGLLALQNEQTGGQVVSLFDSWGGIEGFYGAANTDADCSSCVYFLYCAKHVLKGPHFGSHLLEHVFFHRIKTFCQVSI